MAEQLELFSDDHEPGELPTGSQNGAEDAPEVTGPATGHHTQRNSEPAPDSKNPPDGYVWVTVGKDKTLTETAAAHADNPPARAEAITFQRRGC